jgi:hypothetical protein
MKLQIFYYIAIGDKLFGIMPKKSGMIDYGVTMILPCSA